MTGRGGRGAAILLGGLAAGAFDISYAFVFWWFRSRVPPVRILQSVASGLLGRPAYDGGVPTAILGLFLHVLIAVHVILIGIPIALASRGRRPRA